MQEKKGRVCLLGAGPGDPGLITLKGFRLLKMADVVIYGYLDTCIGGVELCRGVRAALLRAIRYVESNQEGLNQ